MDNIYDIKSITIYALATLLIGAFQSYVIFPIEKNIFGSEVVEYVSLLFIPHAFHVFFIMLLGARGIIPIGIGLFLFTFTYSVDLINNTLITISMASSLLVALILMNYICGRKWSSHIMFLEDSGRLFRAFVVISLVSSFINSIMHNYLYVPNQDLLVHFIVGDTLGAALVALLFVVFRNVIFDKIRSIDGVSS